MKTRRYVYRFTDGAKTFAPLRRAFAFVKLAAEPRLKSFETFSEIFSARGLIIIVI
jgi:hypothetical protein